MKRSGNQRKKAFTLSELLLATAILAFALCGILLAFVTCSFLNESNRNVTRATTHAQHVMEDIKNTTFNTIKTKIDNGDWDWSGATITAEGLTPLNNEVIDTTATGTDLLDVVVTVNWQDRGLRNRTISIETLLVEP